MVRALLQTMYFAGLILMLGSLSSCGSTKETGSKITLLSPSENAFGVKNNDILSVRSVGYGKDEEEASYDAMERAMDVALFQGIPHTGSPLKDALIPGGASEKTVHAEYFKKFYGKREYVNFIQNYTVEFEKSKVNKLVLSRVDMQINLRALRKELEQNGVIRKFGL